MAEMTKSDWYDKLRRRVFTVLSEFSDELRRSKKVARAGSRVAA